jgi:arabinoxylan arabinofuranohydrolase
MKKQGFNPYLPSWEYIPDGTMLGRRKGDQPQLDPGVLREGEKTFLFMGFCGYDTKTRIGATAVTLGPDMLTVLDEPVLVTPEEYNSKGTGFEGHEFLEAPSIRKSGDTYYFIYSSIALTAKGNSRRILRVTYFVWII